MGEEVKVDSTDFKKINEVLSLIASCVDKGGKGAERVLAVSIQRSNINNNLSNAIDKGNKKVKEAIKENNDSSSKNSREVEKLLREGYNLQNEALKKQAKKQEEADKEQGGLLNKIYTKFVQNYPILSRIASSVYSGFKNLTKLQLDNINSYRNFIYGGVFYNEDLDYIHEAASEIGISSKEFSKLILENTKGLSILQGLTNNGVRSYKTLLETTKKTADDYGIDINEATKALGFIVENTYDFSEDNLMKMNNAIVPYLKNLKALSYWTGKSVDQLQQESKIREDDLAAKIWMQNGNKNAQRLNDILTAIGASSEIKAEFAKGLIGPATTKAAVINKELGRILYSLFEYRMKEDIIPEEEFEKGINDLLNSKNRKELENIYKMYPAVAGSLENGIQQGGIMGINLAKLGNLEDARKKVEETKDDEKIAGINKIDRDINTLIEDVKKTLSINSKTIDTFINKTKDASGSLESFKNDFMKVFSKENSDIIQSFIDLFKQHPALSTMTGTLLTSIGIATGWAAKKTYNGIKNLFSGGSKSVDTAEQLKNAKSLMNTPQQQTYKDWLKANPEAKNMPKAERIKQFNKFKSANKTPLSLGTKVKTLGMGAVNTLSVLLGLNTIGDMGSSFYDIFEKGYDDFEKEAILRTKDRGFLGRFLHPGDSLASALAGSDRQKEILNEYYKNQKLNKLENKNIQKNEKEMNQASNMKLLEKNNDSMNNINTNLKSMCDKMDTCINYLKDISDKNEISNNLSILNNDIQKENLQNGISNNLSILANGI